MTDPVKPEPEGPSPWAAALGPTPKAPGPRYLPVLLDYVQVADWLHLPARKVEKMAKLNQIPCIRLPTGDLVFDRDELLMWIDQLRDSPGGVPEGKR